MDSIQKQKALDVLAQRLNRQLAVSFQVCAHCGFCNDSCHYSLAIPDPKMVPAYKADQLRKVFKRQYDWLPRILPSWVGARELNEEAVDRLVEAAFGACTMCRRCVMNCPFGVDTALIVRTARAMLVALGRVPKGLQATVDAHLQTGNNMSVTREEFVETIQWLEEQLQSELGPAARIPINQPGARVMYNVNPREVKYNPMTLLAAAKIFNVAGESWTMSSEHWDVTNYGLFSGDDDAARQIARWVVDDAKKLAVANVVMAECGHGYRAFRWEAETWLGDRFPFEVQSFVEVMAQYIEQRRLRLNPAVNNKRVTYHDPCNQARNGGVIEEPRVILQHAVTEFVEMTPNRAENYCCAGGGGMLSMTEYAQTRLAAGQVKAKQIAATQAQIVATSCHNCLDQLNELNKKYQLHVQIKNLSELVADAIILPSKAEAA
jgi:Fe-S oxidoreductase